MTLSEGYCIQFITATYNLGLAHDNHTHYFLCYQQLVFFSPAAVLFPSIECGHFGHVIEIPRHHQWTHLYDSLIIQTHMHTPHVVVIQKQRPSRNERNWNIVQPLWGKMIPYNFGFRFFSCYKYLHYRSCSAVGVLSSNENISYLHFKLALIFLSNNINIGPFFYYHRFFFRCIVCYAFFLSFFLYVSVCLFVFHYIR